MSSRTNARAWLGLVSASLLCVAGAVCWAFRPLTLTDLPSDVPRATDLGRHAAVKAIVPDVFQAAIWPSLAEGARLVGASSEPKESAPPPLALQFLGLVETPGHGSSRAALYDEASDRVVLAGAGDEVGGARLTCIEPDCIVLVAQGRTTRMVLRGEAR